MNIKLMTDHSFCNSAILASAVISLACLSALLLPIFAIKEAQSAFPARTIFAAMNSSLDLPLDVAFSTAKVMFRSFYSVGLTIEFLAAKCTFSFYAIPVSMILSDKIFRHPFTTADIITKKILVGFYVRFLALNWFAAMGALNNNAVVVRMPSSRIPLRFTFTAAKLGCFSPPSTRGIKLPAMLAGFSKWLIIFESDSGVAESCTTLRAKFSLFCSGWNNLKFLSAFKTFQSNSITHRPGPIKSGALNRRGGCYSDSRVLRQFRAYRKSRQRKGCPNIFSIAHSFGVVNG